jgi:hypothetical protein
MTNPSTVIHGTPPRWIAAATHGPARERRGATARPAPPAHALHALQATAGNRATASLLQVQREPPAAPLPTVATPKTSRDSVSALAETIYQALHVGGLSSDETEAILRGLLQNHDRAADLRRVYQETYKLDLDTDLRGLGVVNALKAHEYLEHGRLRAVVKLAIALRGLGADTTTLWRVLKEVYDEKDVAAKWNALKSAPGLEDFAKEASLDESLDDDLDGYELTKARAILDHGDLQAVDKIVIALSQAGTDEALLFKGLAAANPRIFGDLSEADPRPPAAAFIGGVDPRHRVRHDQAHGGRAVPASSTFRPAFDALPTRSPGPSGPRTSAPVAPSARCAAPGPERTRARRPERPWPGRWRSATPRSTWRACPGSARWSTSARWIPTPTRSGSPRASRRSRPG